MEKARLQKEYREKMRPELKKELNLNNVMEVPRIEKVVLNVGAADDKKLKDALKLLELISGQKPLKTIARKSIAGFKLREGMTIGAKVTLRKQKMYEFLDRLISIALPKVRDFQGVTTKFDKQANYNLGIKESNIFPEIDYDMFDKTIGLNISIETSTKDPAQALALLKQFGMPFKK